MARRGFSNKNPIFCVFANSSFTNNPSESAFYQILTSAQVLATWPVQVSHDILYFDNIYKSSYQNENNLIQTGDNLLLEAMCKKIFTETLIFFQNVIMTK